MTRWRPFSIWHEVKNNELVVHMFGRSVEGKRIKVDVLGARPYFYVPAGEGQVNDIVVEVEHNTLMSLAGPWGPSVSVDRCYVKYPGEIYKVRENYSNTWEADVAFERRFRYDYGIRECIETPDGQTTIWVQDIKASPGLTIEPRICNYDIETRDSLDTETTPEPVIAVALWDSKTDIYTGLYAGALPMPEKVIEWFTEKKLKGKPIICTDERGLYSTLTQFLGAVEPDIMVGWNNLGFDIEYLKNRASHKRYPAPNWKNFEHFDCMEAYSFLVDQRSGNWRGLQEAAQENGFEGKTTKEPITELMARPHDLVIYNVNDIYQCARIMKKHKLVTFFARLAGLAGCSIGDVFDGESISLGRLAGSFMMHRSVGVWALPTKNKERVQTYWYPVVGAIALPPVGGLHQPVIEVDNSTEYVATVRTYNISPETLVRPGDEYDGPCYQMPSGRRYRKEPRGFLPTCLDELAALRVQTKKEIELAIDGAKDADAVAKSLSNTTAYGNISSQTFMLGDPDCGNDITDIPRNHLRWNAEFVAKYERKVDEQTGVIIANEVIGGFTDGVFYVPYPGHDYKKMLVELNKSLDAFAAQFGAEQHHFSVKLEHEYVSGIIRAHGENTRGSYAMVYEDAKGSFERNGKKYSMKIRGFEERRGDAAGITKELQKEILFRAAMGEEVVPYLKDIVGKIRRGEVPFEKVAIAKRWAQEKYTTTPQHVRAAMWSNEHLGMNFKVGSKPLMVFASMPGKPRTDVLAIPWGAPLPDGVIMNWERSIERVVIGPLLEVLNILGVQKQNILADTVPAENFW